MWVGLSKKGGCMCVYKKISNISAEKALERIRVRWTTIKEENFQVFQYRHTALTLRMRLSILEGAHHYFLSFFNFWTWFTNSKHHGNCSLNAFQVFKVGNVWGKYLSKTIFKVKLWIQFFRIQILSVKLNWCW